MDIRARETAHGGVQSADPVVELSATECWDYLERARFGRLGVYANGEVDIIPINIAAHDGKLYFRTAPGTKLDKLLDSGRAAIEIDSVQGRVAYSVVARGPGRILADDGEIAMVNQLPLAPWIPTLKRTYVEVTPVKVTGRRFQLGHEPDEPALHLKPSR
ncbi:MAG TPA: pyridoxamine 5'-phosphate oxidase family protein [Arthrobacter sp.]|nr:pyridoxamine 5'-phosphate oxidase family protein [Arthrobacter sp.]